MTNQDLQHISKTLKKKRVISKSCICPRCKEDGLYTYWDQDSKCHKFRCPTCNFGNFLHNLNYISKKINNLTIL